MEKIKSFFSSGKAKVYAIVMLQITVGIFVGNYFLEPEVVNTLTTSSLHAQSTNSVGLVAVAKCQRDNDNCQMINGSTLQNNMCNGPDNTTTDCNSIYKSCIAATAIIATSTPATTTTATATGTGTGTATGTATGTGTGTGTAANTNKKLFLTTSLYDGNLGGITGADAKCNSDAGKPTGTGTYKAFITDGTVRRACSTTNCTGGVSENLDWVLKPATAYYKADGTTLVFTTNASGTFSTPSDIKATVGEVTSEFWSGIYSNTASGGWTTLTPNTCTSWTVTTGSALRGFPGVIPATNTGDWFGKNNATCSTTRNLLCVEQ